VGGRDAGAGAAVVLGGERLAEAEVEVVARQLGAAREVPRDAAAPFEPLHHRRRLEHERLGAVAVADQQDALAGPRALQRSGEEKRRERRPRVADLPEERVLRLRQLEAELAHQRALRGTGLDGVGCSAERGRAGPQRVAQVRRHHVAAEIERARHESRPLLLLERVGGGGEEDAVDARTVDAAEAVDRRRHRHGDRVLVPVGDRLLGAARLRGAAADPWLGCNPFDPAFRDDPYPSLARLREIDPVNEMPVGIWRLTRYADVNRLLHEVPAGVRTTDGVLPGVDESLTGQRLFMLQQDPPTHTRLRRLVSSAFTPRAIAALRPQIQRIVDGCLDRVAGRGTMDVIADLALPVPATVICEMLGVPVADRDRFTVWTSKATLGLASQFLPPETLAEVQA